MIVKVGVQSQEFPKLDISGRETRCVCEASREGPVARSGKCQRGLSL